MHQKCRHTQAFARKNCAGAKNKVEAIKINGS